jgi:hypothetical protein
VLKNTPWHPCVLASSSAACRSLFQLHGELEPLAGRSRLRRSHPPDKFPHLPFAARLPVLVTGHLGIVAVGQEGLQIRLFEAAQSYALRLEALEARFFSGGDGYLSFSCLHVVSYSGMSSTIFPIPFPSSMCLKAGAISSSGKVSLMTGRKPCSA